MGLGILWIVLILQVFLILIVVAVLKRSLSKELMQVALERFETLKPQEDLTQLKEISVVSHAILDDRVLSRLKTIAAKKFKDVPLTLSTDTAIKGGLRILVGQTIIDCSIQSRLGSLWGGK